MTSAQRMIATVAAYTTKVTPFPGGGAAQWEQCLQPDPRRWWVRFEQASGGSTMPQVFPGETQPAVGTGSLVASPQEFKWLDCPSVVMGSWWTNIGLGGGLVITECLYVGG